MWNSGPGEWVVWGMAITAAMEPTLELPLGELRQADAKWFGGGGCVVEGSGLKHVFVRGTLVGSFGQRDQTTKRLLLVCLAQGKRVHLERLAAAFDVSAGGLRELRGLYRREGGVAVMRLKHGGHQVQKGSTRVQRKLEEAFSAGASVNEAWEAVGRKAGLGRSTVGSRRFDWAARVAEERAARPPLKVVPAEQAALMEAATASMSTSASAVSSEVAAAMSTSDVSREVPAAVVTEAESPAPAEGTGMERTEKLKSSAVETEAHVQHLGTWLLVAMVARLGLHGLAQASAERRVSADAVRVALDAVVMALGVGQRCVEGVRRLATSTAATLMIATGMPSPTWVRSVLGRFSSNEGGMRLHLGMAGAYLREAQASVTAAGPVFYVDNHMRPYTGQKVIRHGWRMQDKRVRPGMSDYYVHDEDGRPVMRMASPSHDSLTVWLSPIARLLRHALGPEETILLAFDRAGAFPKQMAALREDDFEFVTYERRPYRTLPDAAFTEEVTLDGEKYRFCDTRKNLGKGRGRVRRIAVKLPDGHQLNLLANSKRSAVELLEVMSGRWRQENGFKHGVERWGINQLDGRRVQSFDPDTIIPNPARRRLDRAIRIARAEEGDGRSRLAKLDAADAKRVAVQKDIDAALKTQARLEALRPSRPPHAALRDTELADTLVHHTVEYKLVLDTIRIACANAESELAVMLAPRLPRGAEAKKTLANLFASPGAIRVGRNAIHVQLDPAGNRPERKALEALLAEVTRLNLSMPGDQQARPLSFTLAQSS